MKQNLTLTMTFDTSREYVAVRKFLSKTLGELSKKEELTYEEEMIELFIHSFLQ